MFLPGNHIQHCLYCIKPGNIHSPRKHPSIQTVSWVQPNWEGRFCSERCMFIPCHNVEGLIHQSVWEEEPILSCEQEIEIYSNRSFIETNSKPSICLCWISCLYWGWVVDACHGYPSFSPWLRIMLNWSLLSLSRLSGKQRETLWNEWRHPPW